RDKLVTGVQTCALPIWAARAASTTRSSRCCASRRRRRTSTIEHCLQEGRARRIPHGLRTRLAGTDQNGSEKAEGKTDKHSALLQIGRASCRERANVRGD